MSNFTEENYIQKYLKYKTKYLELKNKETQDGGYTFKSGHYIFFYNNKDVSNDKIKNLHNNNDTLDTFTNLIPNKGYYLPIKVKEDGSGWGASFAAFKDNFIYGDDRFNSIRLNNQDGNLALKLKKENIHDSSYFTSDTFKSYVEQIYKDNKDLFKSQSLDINSAVYVSSYYTSGWFVPKFGPINDL